MQEMCLSQEIFISCFQGDREVSQSVSLALVILEETLIQNNQYAIVAYLGAAKQYKQRQYKWNMESYSRQPFQMASLT